MLPVQQRPRLPLPHSADYRSRPPPHTPCRALGVAALAALLGVFAPPLASAATTTAPQLALGWTLDTTAPTAWTTLSSTTVTTTSTLAFATGGRVSVSLWLRAANAGTAALPAAALSFHIAPASSSAAPANRGWYRRRLLCTVAGAGGTLSLPALAATAQLGVRGDCSLPTRLTAGNYQVWACAKVSARGWRWWRRSAKNCSASIALTLSQGPEPNLRTQLQRLNNVANSTNTLTLATGGATTLELSVAVDNTGTTTASSTSLSYRIAQLRTYTRPWWRGGGTVTRLSWAKHLSCDTVVVPALAAAGRFSAQALCQLPSQLDIGDYRIWACVKAVPWERQRADNCSAQLALSVVEGTRPNLSFASLQWSILSAASNTAALTLTVGSTATLSLSLTVASTGTATAAASSLSYHIAPEYRSWRRGRFLYPALHSIHLSSCAPSSVPSLPAAASFSASASCVPTARLAAGSYSVWACVQAVPWEHQRADNCSARLSLSVVAGARPNLRLEAYWAASGAPAAASSWLPASTATTIIVATSTPVLSSGTSATLSLWLAAENTGAALAAASQLRYFIAPNRVHYWHRWQRPWQRARALRNHGWHRSRHGGYGNAASTDWHDANSSSARRQQLDCGAAKLPTLAAGAGLLARRDCQLPTGLATGSYRVWACLQGVPWEQRLRDNCATALPLELAATTPIASTGTATIRPITGTGVAQLSIALGWRTDGSTATSSWLPLAADAALPSTFSLTLATDDTAQSLPLLAVLSNVGSATATPITVKYYLSGTFWQLQLHSEWLGRWGLWRGYRGSGTAQHEGYSWRRHSVELSCGAAPSSVAAGQRLQRQLDCALPTGTATGNSYRLWACSTAGENTRPRKCSQRLSVARPAATSALRLSLSGPTTLSALTLRLQLGVENTGSAATASATLSYYLTYRSGWWRPLDCGAGATAVPPLAAGATHSRQQSCTLPSLRTGDYQLKVCLDLGASALAPRDNCQSLVLRANAALLATMQASVSDDGDELVRIHGTAQPNTQTLPTQDADTVDTDSVRSSASAQRAPAPFANFARRLRVAATAAAQTVRLPVLIHGDAAAYPVELPFTVSASSNAPFGVDGHTVLPSSGVISISSGRRGEITLQLPAAYASLDGNPVVLSFTFAASGARNAAFGRSRNLRVTILPAATNLRPRVLHVVRDGVAGVQLRQPAESTPSRSVAQSTTPVELGVWAHDPNGDAITFQWELLGPLPSRAVLMSAQSTGTLSGDAWVARFSFNPQSLELDQRYLNRVLIDDGRGGITEVHRRFHVVAEGATVPHRHDHDGNGIGDPHQHHDLHHLLQGTPTPSTQHVLTAESGISIALGEYSERAYQQRGAAAAALPSDDVLLNSVAAGGFALGAGGIYDFELRGVEHDDSDASGASGGEAMVVVPQQAAIPAAAVYIKYSENDNGWQPFDHSGKNALHSAPLGADSSCPSPDDSSGVYQEGLIAGHHCVRLTLVDGGANDADGTINGTVADPGGIATLTPAVIISGGAVGALSSLGLLLLLLLSLVALPARTRRRG